MRRPHLVSHSIFSPKVKNPGIIPGMLIPSTGGASPAVAAPASPGGNVGRTTPPFSPFFNSSPLFVVCVLSLAGKFYSLYQYYQSPRNQAPGDECREVRLEATVQVSVTCPVPPFLGWDKVLGSPLWLWRKPRVALEPPEIR